MRALILYKASVVGATVVAAFCLAVAPSFSQESDVEKFRAALINYFLPLNYLPVLVNRGYTVGDVIDVDGVNFYARAQRCFPTLKLSALTDTTLDNAVLTDSTGLSFGLKLRQLFSSTAGADLVRRFRITFSDTKVLAATRLDFKDALDRNACPEIAPLVDGTFTVLDKDKKPFFIISEIIYGKREARLELTDKANLSADAEHFVQVIGDASVQLKVGTTGTVEVKSDTVLPIAMKPLTVPKVTVAEFKDSVRGEQRLQRLWIQCETTDNCSGLFTSFVNTVKASKPTITDSELDE